MRSHQPPPQRTPHTRRPALPLIALLLGSLPLAAACGGETASTPTGGQGANGQGSNGQGGQGQGSHGQGSSGQGSNGQGSTGQGSNGQGGQGTIGVDPNDDPRTPVTKVDLLLMIDNSASMADKQAILSRALPDLIGRLTSPDCVVVDAAGRVTQRKAASGGSCPAGSTPELGPIADIHIGVISSSLGGHGSDLCDPKTRGADDDDRARLLTRAPQNSTVSTWGNGSGFLQWDPTAKQAPPGENDANALLQAARDLVLGAGETGCGFESSLEATYRFLIDPAPPKDISVLDPASPNIGTANVTGIDDELLQQRAEFLRPDSFVAVVVLSDENDCSTIDGMLPSATIRDGKPAAGWSLARNGGFPINFAAQIGQAGNKEFRMRSGTAACAVDPESDACTDCFRDASGPGCRDLTRAEDNLSLRCWDQKRRFGVDMLYPVQRYIDGFQEHRVFDLRQVDANGAAALVDNPLFQDLPRLRYETLNARLSAGTISRAQFDAGVARLGADVATRAPVGPRSRRSIAFTAIVGVPWQDLANDPNDLGAGYKRTEDLVWPNVRSTNGSPPADPLMIESVKPRTGLQPITGEPVGVGTANSINGHEWESEAQDLMYACITRLPVAKDCENATGNCDCTYGSGPGDPSATALAQAAQNPLCQAGAGAPFEQKQYAAKAYPGGRFVEVAHGLSGRSVLASICAPNVVDDSRQDFGYRAVVSALVDRMRTVSPAP